MLDGGKPFGQRWMTVVRIDLRIRELVLHRLVQQAGDPLISAELLESGHERHLESGIYDGNEFLAPVGIKCHSRGMDTAQPLNQRCGADGAGGEGVGRELLLPRDRLGGPKEEPPVNEEGHLQQTPSAQIANRSANRLPRAIDPGPKLDVTAVVVPELVRENGPKLRDA